MHSRTIGLGLTGVAVAVLCLVASSEAKDHHRRADGKKLFEQHCASCHLSGGNRVNPNRPLAGSDKLNTLAQFKDYLSAPPGHMPYYQQVVGDKQMLEALYKYCKTLPKEPLKQASL